MRSDACADVAQELHAPSTSQSRHKEFWVTQTTFLARLKRSPLLTLAAIRGDYQTPCRPVPCGRAI